MGRVQARIFVTGDIPPAAVDEARAAFTLRFGPLHPHDGRRRVEQNGPVVEINTRHQHYSDVDPTGYWPWVRLILDATVVAFPDGTVHYGEDDWDVEVTGDLIADIDRQWAATR